MTQAVEVVGFALLTPMPHTNCCMKVSSKRAANASLISSVILTEITSSASSLLVGFPLHGCCSPDFELNFGGRALDDLASCQWHECLYQKRSTSRRWTGSREHGATPQARTPRERSKRPNPMTLQRGMSESSLRAVRHGRWVRGRTTVRRPSRTAEKIFLQVLGGLW